MNAFTVWFTGLPCSGKTTLAILLYNHFLQQGMLNVELLDGDVVRQYLTRGLGFTKQDRDENIRRIGWLSRMLNKHGVNTIVAAISPYRDVREEQKRLIENFFEVYVKCPVEVCEKRDVKGMYKKARQGLIKHFTGVDDPYEEPLNPDLVIETDKLSVEDSFKMILKALSEKKLVGTI
ncbi:MAG: adenylyl-sulfate kinase [bacterium]